MRSPSAASAWRAYASSVRELLALALLHVERAWWRSVGCAHVAPSAAPAEHERNCARATDGPVPPDGPVPVVGSEGQSPDLADEAPARAKPRHPDMVMYRVSYNVTTGTYHARVINSNSST